MRMECILINPHGARVASSSRLLRGIIYTTSGDGGTGGTFSQKSIIQNEQIHTQLTPMCHSSHPIQPK